jgi:hypothetical protein
VVGVVDGGASVVVVIVVVVGSLVVGGGRNVLGAIRLGNTSTIGTKRCLRMGCCSGKKNMETFERGEGKGLNWLWLG